MWVLPGLGMRRNGVERDDQERGNCQESSSVTNPSHGDLRHCRQLNTPMTLLSLAKPLVWIALLQGDCRSQEHPTILAHHSGCNLRGRKSMMKST
jgi:hypothetical protein